MKSMFSMGFQPSTRKGLGFFPGFSELLSVGIQAGAEVYKAHEQKEIQEDLLAFKERQAAQAAAKEAEALKLQQEAAKALQQQQVGAVPGGTILGLQPTAFYTIAGLSVAALLAGILLFKK